MKYFVYCLYKDGEIIYIGSSTQLINRLKSHRKDKEFDSVCYCELPNKQLMLEFEEYGIYNLNPRINKKVLYKPDRPEIEVVWNKLDLYVLLPEASPDQVMQVCFDYHEYQADILGISYQLRHNLFHMEGEWSFERQVTEEGVTILARSDRRGKSVDELCSELGGLSSEDFRYDWMKHRNIRDRF